MVHVVLQALAEYNKRPLVLGNLTVTVLPKIPKVHRMGGMMPGGGRGRGDRMGGDFRRTGSQGTFGGRGEWLMLCLPGIFFAAAFCS